MRPNLLAGGRVERANPFDRIRPDLPIHHEHPSARHRRAAITAADRRSPGELELRRRKGLEYAGLFPHSVSVRSAPLRPIVRNASGRKAHRANHDKNAHQVTTIDHGVLHRCLAVWGYARERFTSVDWDKRRTRNRPAISQRQRRPTTLTTVHSFGVASQAKPVSIEGPPGEV